MQMLCVRRARMQEQSARFTSCGEGKEVACRARHTFVTAWLPDGCGAFGLPPPSPRHPGIWFKEIQRVISHPVVDSPLGPPLRSDPQSYRRECIVYGLLP